LHTEPFNELLARNRDYAKGHPGGDIPPVPALKTAVVTCMDCRIDAYSALGLRAGEAHVIRNAGGRARDALRSLVVSQRQLGTRQIVLITHTTCGMSSFRGGDLRGELGPAADGIDFDTFDTPEQAAADDADWLAAHPLVLPETTIGAFVFDVLTGELRHVKTVARPSAGR